MYFIDKFCFWTLWNYSNQFTSYDEYLHYECIIQTLFVKPTVCFYYLNTFYTVSRLDNMILESESSAWSLQVSSYRQKSYCDFIFNMDMLSNCDTLIIHWSCIRRREWGKTVFNTVCIWIICMVYTVCVVQRCLKLIFVFLRLKKALAPLYIWHVRFI